MSIISSLFIIVMVVSFLIVHASSGQGWGNGVSPILLILVIIPYLPYCVFGNIYYLMSGGSRLGIGLLNLPALVIGISCFLYWASHHPPSFSFTIKVLNEFDEPIVGQDVVFLDHYSRRKDKTKKTDKNGNVYWQKVPLIKTSRSTKFQIDRKGYYPQFGNGDYTRGSIIEGVWLLRYVKPWNRIMEVTLKPVINPTPLYVNNLVNIDVDHLLDGKEHGYDLVIADWLPPNGSGVVADLLLKTTRSESHMDYVETLLLTLPGSGNGIQHVKVEPDNYSLLSLPRMSPQEGYKQSMTFDVGGEGGLSSAEGNYFFKVRSDKVDKLKSDALFGKIIGPIYFYPESGRENYRLYLNYYLNPNPNDHNLEFDPERNLLEKDTYQGVQLLTGKHFL